MHQTELFDHVCQAAPLSCMAQVALGSVFQAEAVDRIFREHAVVQYEGDLAFSAVVDLMLAVSCKIAPTVNSAFKRYGETIGVSVTSVYNKLQGIEPEVTRAMVRETARSMKEVAEDLNPHRSGSFARYEVRILDGSHLEGSHHRIKETRKKAAAPLPGLGLVVLDPRHRLMIDYIPCEDAHAQERSLLPQLIDGFQAGELWIADRNFCTAAFLWELENNQAFFIIRKHATNVAYEAADPEIPAGNVETGDVFEQSIDVLDDFGGRFRARRVRLVLKSPTRDGDTEIVILSNLPKDISAQEIAEGYRQRWSIESAFGEIRRCLNGEINALGYPKAALFSFAMALVSFNVLSIIADAIGASHGEEAKEDFSTQQAAVEIQHAWRGTTIIFNQEFWLERTRGYTPQQTAVELKRLALLVKLSWFKKYKRPKRSPRPTRVHDPTEPHVSTAKLLDARK